MSIAKEKSPSAATPGLQKNVAPAVTEPPSSLPEHTGCFCDSLLVTTIPAYGTSRACTRAGWDCS